MVLRSTVREDICLSFEWCARELMCVCACEYLCKRIAIFLVSCYTARNVCYKELSMYPKKITSIKREIPKHAHACIMMIVFSALHKR